MVRLKMAGKEDPESKKKFDELRKTGTPVASIELQGYEDLGAELFKWEVATALACSRFGVNPFLDPDTRASRARAAELLDRYREKHQLPLRTVRVREAGVDLYAEGETRRELSTLNMVEALRSFFALRRQGSYVALLPFMHMSPERSTILYRMRDHLEACLGVPVLATSGPKYLRTLAQVYHGGPAKGLFVFVTADPAKDLVVPGADYSFGQLQMALALGEFDVLCGRGRPVIRLHLASGVERGLEQVESILNSALGKRHTAAS